jgi:hypothetical protein
MSFFKARGWVKVMVVAALAAGSVARTASAQVLKGRFTLPYEVRWGMAVLPAGTYLIIMDNVRGPALLTTTEGEAAVSCRRASSIPRPMVRPGC